MIDAHINVLTTILLLLDETGRQASATRIDYRTTFLAFDRGMQTQVFSTREAKPPKIFFVAQLLGTVLHQLTQLSKRLLDLGHCSYILSIGRRSLYIWNKNSQILREQYINFRLTGIYC